MKISLHQFMVRPHWIFGILIAAIPNLASAQAYKSEANAGAELMLTVDHPTASITVTITPTDLDDLLPDVVTTNSNSNDNWDWEGDFNCASGGYYRDFECNTLYTITFDVEGSSNDLEFQYFQCEGNDESYDASLHGFYCIDAGTSNLADIQFKYTSEGDWELYLWSVYDPIQGYTPEVSGIYNLSSSNWTWPWDFDMLCNKSSTCEATAKNVAYFLAPHSDTTNYVLAADSIGLPSGTWTWDNKNLEFAPGAVLKVVGQLDASNTEFSAFGDPWKGIVFEDGSTGNITNGSVVEEFNSDEGNNGIDILGGTVTISNSQILNDNWPWGYGIEVSDGILTLTDSYVFADRGHGVLARSDGHVYLENTDFEVYHSDDGLSAVAANWGGEVDDDPAAVYYGTGNFLRATGSAATSITANAGTYLCGMSLGTYPEMVYASDDADVSVTDAYWAAVPPGSYVTEYNGGDISTTGFSSCIHLPFKLIKRRH